MPQSVQYKSISIDIDQANVVTGSSFFTASSGIVFTGYFQYSDTLGVVSLYDSNGVNIELSTSMMQPSFYTDDYTFNFTIVNTTGSTYFVASPNYPITMNGTGNSAGDASQAIIDNGNLYDATTTSGSPPMIIFSSYTPPRVVCFKEDSKVLCLINDVEKYVPIQDIRKGVLVKTSLNGYKAVELIGTSLLLNNENTPMKDRLFICSKHVYPELFEDLVITGSHSILVDSLTDKEREGIVNVVGRIFVTDNKYRLMACVDERAKLFDQTGEFNIYHLALENNNELMNYGIYANGLLVETCSINFLKNKSTMKLLK